MAGLIRPALRTRGGPYWVRHAVALLLVLGSSPLFAAEKYAVIITGASGGEGYAKKYDAWRRSLATTLGGRLGYDADHVVLLAEREGDGELRATRENVQRVFADLRKRLAAGDQLLVVLIGHGTSLDGPEGDDAKYNLVGPDLSATEWAELLKPLPGRLVFVNTTGGSYPFLRKLARRGRIVLTATDSAAQRFDTVFPEYFVNAFADHAADTDKNGKVSIWEAFGFATAGVRRWFDQHGQLPTERPLLDDTGAGVGREAEIPGPDGALARATYLEADPISPRQTDAAVTALLKRRAGLEASLERLRDQKATLPADQYDAALEKLLLEIAQIEAQLRPKS